MEYLEAFFGSFVWAVILWSIAKNPYDSKKIDFPYGQYCKQNIDNWLVTLACAPILVWYLPDIVSIINERTGWNLKFYKIYYLGVGVFVELLYVGIALLFKWKQKFIPDLEK